MALIGLCEDDPPIRRVVVKTLQFAGHEVVVTHTGSEAVRRLGPDVEVDVLILDIGLPDADGRDVCQALRSHGQTAPVMFLTALGAVPDRLAGFHVGADDYLPKPFDPLELLARVEALARRRHPPTANASSAFSLDPVRHAVVCHGREIRLTPLEYRMLASLSSRPGEVVRRRTIAAAAWPGSGWVSDNSIDSYIRRLRRKLREVQAPLELTTVRGVGYTLR